MQPLPPPMPTQPYGAPPMPTQPYGAPPMPPACPQPYYGAPPPMAPQALPPPYGGAAPAPPMRPPNQFDQNRLYILIFLSVFWFCAGFTCLALIV